MTSAEVITLLKFLDNVFQLGGKLIETAIQKTPQLRTDPLPNLSEMEQARRDAISRIKKRK